MTKRGAIIVNTGTPDAPTPDAVRKYLREFLSDPRICPTPPVIWNFILNSFILPKRSHASAEKYASIWQDDRSPLEIHMRSLAAKTEAAFEHKLTVRYAMSYGTPSITDALKELHDEGCEKLTVIPLYPQSAHSTSLVVKDKLTPALQELEWNPKLHFVENYCDQTDYIDAIAETITGSGLTDDDRLLFAFHSIPMRDIKQGDTYSDQVFSSARAIARRAGLSPEQWTVGFQCRFDRSRAWLGPTTLEALQSLSRDKGRLFVVAPNFSVDCLETLYDIEIVLRQKVAEMSGPTDPNSPQQLIKMRYIPCLNDSDAHVLMLKRIIEQAI